MKRRSSRLAQQQPPRKPLVEKTQNNHPVECKENIDTNIRVLRKRRRLTPPSTVGYNNSGSDQAAKKSEPAMKSKTKVKPKNVRKKRVVKSESDSDFESSVENYRSGRTKSKYFPMTVKADDNKINKPEPKNLSIIAEDPEESESEDAMMVDVEPDTFKSKYFRRPEEVAKESSDIEMNDSSQSKSQAPSDVMKMLMAHEVKPYPSSVSTIGGEQMCSKENGATVDDSEDDWEMVEVETAKESQSKKRAKKTPRKRKVSDDSADLDFESSQKETKPSKGAKKNQNSDEKKPQSIVVKKEELTEAEKEIRRFANRCMKDRDSCHEQCSLVLQIAFLRNCMKCVTRQFSQAIMISLLPSNLDSSTKSLESYLSALLDWYTDMFSLELLAETDTKPQMKSCVLVLVEFISSRRTSRDYIYVMGFCSLLLAVGLETRLVGSLYVQSLEKVAKNVKLSKKQNPNPTFWAEVRDSDTIFGIDVCNAAVTPTAFDERCYLKPQGYIVSVTEELVYLDSTPKYCEKWAMTHRKSRVLNHEFWDDFIVKQPGHSIIILEHNKLMKTVMLERGLPNSLGGFKHNLVYFLEKDLLKIEAIYPQDAPILGTFKSQNVYSRDNVRPLKQMIVIKKEGRGLIEGEIPYKIVKQKILFDRWPGDDRWKDVPLYGEWQTEIYKPPTAENGIVPRNEFGNVELFQPWMLPLKTEHVDLPGSYSLARKLNINAAHAVTGFEFPRCRAVPVMSGVVVCEDKAEILRDAWVEYNAEKVKKAEVRFIFLIGSYFIIMRTHYSFQLALATGPRNIT